MGQTNTVKSGRTVPHLAWRPIQVREKREPEAHDINAPHLL